MVNVLKGVGSLSERVSVYSKDNSAVDLVESKGIITKLLLSKKLFKVDNETTLTLYFDTVEDDLLRNDKNVEKINDLY